MPRKPLHQADSLYRRRDWAGLIALLEPLSPVYRDNKGFCVMLGNAYLRRDDTGGAYSFFRRAQTLDYRDPSAALGLAAVYLKRGESDKAVQLYVEMLERDPADRRAGRALEFLRKHPDLDVRGDESVARRLRRLYPKPPLPAAAIAVPALVIAVAAAALLVGPRMVDAVRDAAPRRPGIVDISLAPEDLAAPVGSEGGFELVLTESEAIAAFERAKALFTAYRDEAALVEVNRLLLSNASRSIKAKAEALARYAREPSFLRLPDRYAYPEVKRDPGLYEGVAVAWKGLPANVDAGEAGTSFDFLVGYEDRTVLEGIVRVVAGFELKLTADRPIELLARVRRSRDGFYLECVAVHEL